jgi:preprotein translocase subunit YajC
LSIKGWQGIVFEPQNTLPDVAPGGSCVNAQQVQQAAPVLLWVAIFVVFYFMLIRPQQMQQRRYREMLGKLKKGDRVLTKGGLYAVVLEIKDNQLTLELAQNVRVRAERSAVQAVVNKGGTGA